MTEKRSIHVRGHDLDIAVIRAGASGAPLVFLHGLGSSSTLGLRNIAAHPLLAGQPRVLIDMPGFGASSAPAAWDATIEAQADVAAAVMDHLGVTFASVIGHSMGGSVAIMLAGARRDLVRRLIVAEPLLAPEDGTLSAHIARQPEERFVARGFPALLMATRRQAARGDVASIGFLRTLEQADPTMMHRSAVSLLAPRDPSFQDRLRALTIPRTFIAGTRSAIDTASLSAAGIRISVIPDAGHSMMDENPERFARAIAAALVDRQHP
jgi:pimeloyl-ACP methyl ester carboxylesterase